MANISILDKQHCTGCSLCMSVCPKNAIELRPNEEGFLFPTINDSCIDCGICAKKCPQLSKNYTYENGQGAYAIWAKEGFRKQGSSGGVFPVIAEKTISQKGVVFGAGFNDDFTRLYHMGITSKKDLHKIYKSKYLQSDVSSSLPKVKMLLESGKRVVFSGCPCQVDALKTYLGKDYENLFTIDILCHGVPSPLAYNRFLEEVRGEKKVKNVDFRDKKWGWGTLISVDFAHAFTHYDHYNGNYFRAFLSGLSMREACYNCKYATHQRVGDITLGDFWGVDKYKEDWNDKKGTSILLCNTEKGKAMLDSIKDELQRIEEVPYERAMEISDRANAAITRPTARNNMRKCFFYHLNKGDSFSRSVAYAEQSRMDIGIVGWWIETKYSNYGSTLTDFALYKYLSSLGLSVATISPPNFDRRYAGEFNKKYGYRMTAKYSHDQMDENNKYFDGFVVASDVLWYYDAFIRQGYNFLLDFADDTKRKLSYSTSFGNTVKFFPKSEQPYAKYLMQRFDHVSVREFEGVELCKKHFDVNATQVLDPVFLCDKKEYLTVASNAPHKTEGDFIFAYMLDPNSEKARALAHLAKRLKCQLVTITDKQVNSEKKREILKDYGVIPDANIEDFMYHIVNAKMVVADSFHGFCFSLIFDKPFIALVNRTRGGSRFDSLAGQLDCKDRMIEDIDDLYSLDNDFLLEIDSEKIQANIKKETERSKKWLHNALFSERTPKEIAPELSLAKELYVAKKKILSLEEKIRQLEGKK